MKDLIERKLPQRFILSKYYDVLMWELAELRCCLNNSDTESEIDYYISQSKEALEAPVQKAGSKEHITSEEKQGIIKLLNDVKSIYQSSDDYARRYNSNASFISSEGSVLVSSVDAKIQGTNGFVPSSRELINKNPASLIGK